MMRQQLVASRRVLGDTHPHTLASLSNLAYVLHASGKHAQAAPLLREEVAASAAALGPRHPETLVAVRRLGQGLEKLGHLEEALVLYCQHFGPRHPRSIALAQRLRLDATAGDEVSLPSHVQHAELADLGEMQSYRLSHSMGGSSYYSGGI